MSVANSIVRRLLGGGGGGGGDIIYAPIPLPFHAGAAVAMTNAAADTEFNGSVRRVPYILPAGVPCWIMMSSSGNANGSSTVDIRYSKNGGATFLPFGVSVDITAQSGATVFGAWVEVPEDAKGDYIAAVFINGNGAADPSFSSLYGLITFEDPT